LIFGCFAWALSIAPVSDLMVRGLESQYGSPKNVKGDVIILLSGPSEAYFTRILTAVRLQKSLGIHIIASGVKASKHRVAKASIVKRFLLELGIPSEKVIEEDKSRDTFENAEFTKEICIRMGFTNPILVTSAYQMKRAIMSFEKVGIKVTPYPVWLIYRKEIPYKWDEYLPGDFSIASTAIKEYWGLVFYNFAY